MSNWPLFWLSEHKVKIVNIERLKKEEYENKTSWDKKLEH